MKFCIAEERAVWSEINVERHDLSQCGLELKITSLKMKTCGGLKIKGMGLPGPCSPLLLDD